MRAIFYYELFIISILFAFPLLLIAEPSSYIPEIAKKQPVSVVVVSKRHNPLSDKQKAVISENKAKVAEYFSDIPEMLAIINCESGFKQFDWDGKTLTSETKDVGIAQVNLYHWEKKAIELGYDIRNSLDDNLKMARYVYEQQGLTAWTCYNKNL